MKHNIVIGPVVNATIRNITLVVPTGRRYTWREEWDDVDEQVFLWPGVYMVKVTEKDPNFDDFNNDKGCDPKHTCYYHVLFREGAYPYFILTSLEDFVMMGGQI